jgi:hypothetical protein
LTEEKLYNISARLEHLPRKSLAKLDQQADVSIFSARIATKLLKLLSSSSSSNYLHTTIFVNLCTHLPHVLMFMLLGNMFWT